MSVKETVGCACKSGTSSVLLNLGVHLLTCVVLPVGLTLAGATAAASALGALSMGTTAAISAGVAGTVMGGWYLAKYRCRRPMEKAVFLASALILTAGTAYFNTSEAAHRMHHSIRGAFNTHNGSEHPVIDPCDPLNWCGSLPPQCRTSPKP